MIEFAVLRIRSRDFVDRPIRPKNSIHEITRNGANKITPEPVKRDYSGLSSALSGFTVSAA